MDITALAKILEKCTNVARYDTAEEPQAWVLAHALIDTMESFRSIQDELLPKLMEAKVDADIKEVLDDIEEEFRHIMYHLRDTKYFEYVVNYQWDD